MWIDLFLCLSHLFIGVMLSIKCFQKWEFRQKTKKGVDHMRGVVCKKGVKASAQFEDEKWVGQKGVSTSINVLYLKFYQKHVQHPKNSAAKIRVKQKTYLTFFYKCHQFQPCIISTFKRFFLIWEWSWMRWGCFFLDWQFFPGHCTCFIGTNLVVSSWNHEHFFAIISYLCL